MPEEFQNPMKKSRISSLFPESAPLRHAAMAAACASVFFCPAPALNAEESAPGGGGAYERAEIGYPFWGEYARIDFKDVRPAPWEEKDSVKDGWDWSLPPGSAPSPDAYMSLFRTWGPGGIKKMRSLPALPFPCIPVVEHWCYWRDIEKEENSYDFRPLADMIKAAAERGYGSAVRLHTGGVGFAPEWLKEYGIPVLENDGRSGDGISSYDVSHPEFHRRYLKLVEELGKSGIPQMAEVKGLYVGYASPSNGDEGIGPEGTDPDSVAHVRERLDAWAEAAKGAERKVYMGGWSGYGLSKGFGVRRGFVEMYLYHIPDAAIGQRIDRDGYLFVDEDAPLIKSGARNGEENEEYEPEWASQARGFRFGRTTDSFNYRYFTSTLRLLQMRCNFALWNEFTPMPEMFAWAAVEIGKSAADAPDAWCFLRESYLRRDLMKSENAANPDAGLKNFERWLYQRDAEGFETEPAVKIGHAVSMWMVDKRRPFDYVARRGARIGFRADEKFISGKKRRVCVKVSHFDFGRGKFALEYFSDGKRERREAECLGTGRLRTATFFVEADFQNRERGGFDIEIAGMDGYRPVVSFLRIIRLPQTPAGK